MAVVQELIRAGRKNLTIVGCVNSIETDMLIGAVCVSAIETSYVGLEKYGLAKKLPADVAGWQTPCCPLSGDAGVGPI